MTDDRLLGIYLNDHLAGETAGRNLAQRCLSHNSGTALGGFLRTFLGELEVDRTLLEQVMDRVGTRSDPLKQGFAWFLERAARLKLNGALTSYSDLSRLEEVEGLCLGVEGKLSMWRALRRLAESDRRLGGFDFHQAEGRAKDQRRILERHRLEAARRAFKG